MGECLSRDTRSPFHDKRGRRGLRAHAGFMLLKIQLI
jgi:hypothetical protein